MKNAFLMVGVSGAGKSTYVNKLCDAFGVNTFVFSLDLCRLSFYDKNYFAKKIDYATAFQYAIDNQETFDKYVSSMWATTLTAQTVIVDNTNLTKKSRARWVNDLRSKGFKITAVQVNVPLHIALSRQISRGDKSVPDSVVRDMYMRQQEILLGSEADALINIDSTSPDNKFSLLL